MLSMILYGRNDTHGYNLHKRAALSLNALAEVLDDPDDEIIFVDYNTPDELPTFLETIADTLTERAKRYIRIIRVRPEFHRQYGHITHLVALESQSRNIAIRRSNPANRWILSTNTDMIFVPEKRRDTLSGIVGQLSDGFYHLPRFEVPEGFWERSNRLDPQGMIEQMRTSGTRYHLNEVVYGGFDNVYEAPGDFQLFLRDDLERIGGFDETMLKGWHVDANMARRMKLLRGKVDTLFPQLYGYHCGHTRQATSLHGARRTENSLDTYVRDIQTPYWTSDDAWGAPDEVFEELRLTHAQTPLYLEAMSAAVEVEGPSYTEATYNEATYCQEGFDASHILPHLGDIVFNMKPGQTVFFVGTDHELFSGFGKFITLPPMHASLFVCSDEHSPGAMTGLPSLTLAEGIERADVLVLQYPNARSAPQDQQSDSAWYIQKALEEIISAERKRERIDRRRIIVVNGVHTRLQELIGEALDASAMPYSTRLRQGRVFDPHWQMHLPTDTSRADSLAYAQLGRLRTFAPVELATLSRIFAAGQSPPEVDGWERLAPEITALASMDDFLKERLGADPEKVAGTQRLAQEEISRAEARVASPVAALPPRPNVSNRICSGADWESPQWLALATRYFGERAYSQATRSRWLWERVSLVLELRRRLAPEPRPWILVAAEGPDPIAAMVAHQGFRVAYVETEALLNGTPTRDWSGAFNLFSTVLPSSLVPLDKAPTDLQFAGMLAPGSTFFWRERQRANRIIAKTAPMMLPKAQLGLSSLVHINSSLSGGALALHELETAFDPGGVMSMLGITGDAPVDARIPLDTAARFAANDRDTEAAPGLSFGFGPDACVSMAMLWGRFSNTAHAADDPPTLEPATDLPIAAPATLPAATRQAASAWQMGRNDADLATAKSFATAMRPRVLAFPALFTSLRRNFLPSLVSANIQERSLMRVLIAADPDDKVRFGVPIASVGHGTICLHLAVAGVSGPDAVRAVFVGANDLAEGVVTGSRGILSVRFELAESLGDGLAVLEICAQALEISVLAATRESAAMSIA